jgi:hypothetical protein
MSSDNDYQTKPKEYTVKRVEENLFELWLDEDRLATLSKDEAWPVMLGRVHPEDMLKRKEEEAVA